MLLLLTAELQDELPRVLGESALRDAFSNLALAHREGNHILSGPITLLAQLSEARELSAETRGTFKQIKLRHHQAKTLRESVRHFVLIEPSARATRNLVSENHEADSRSKGFPVPLAYFSTSGRAQPSRLVAEDRDDARVYQRAAKAYVCRADLKGLGVSFQIYGGGGANTADALRDHAPYGPTVCVVDADYKWSDDQGQPALGDTAKRVMKVTAEFAGTSVCTVHAVPCREIENLLPTELVLACFVPGDRGDFHKWCVQASDLGFFGGGPRVDRLDLKKGLRRKDYEAIPPEHPQHRYLKRIFDESQNRARKPALGWCGDERRCSGDSPCECVLFEGVGDGLLARVADRLDKLTPQKIAEHLLASGQPHEPAWTEIGSLLFAWGCAYPRTRT